MICPNCGATLELVSPTLSLVSLPPLPPPPPSAYTLLSMVGGVGSPLDGQTVSGNIYVVTAPDTDVTQVRFFLDGALFGTQGFAPFSFAGDAGGVLAPFDTTTLTNGPHTISAELDHAGAIDTITTGFTVANQVIPYTRLLNVTTATDLLAAVGAALPGDKIALAPGTYNLPQRLLINRDGTQANPIQLAGPRTTILDFGSLNANGVTLGIYDNHGVHGADWWVLSGFAIRRCYKALVLWNSNHNVIRDLLIDEIGQSAVQAKGPQGSSDNIFRENEIRNTGRLGGTEMIYSEAIYIGSGSLTAGGDNVWSPSHRNWIYRNKFGPNVTADHVDVKQTTRGTVVEENISDCTGFRFHNGTLDGQANTNGVYTCSQQLDGAKFLGNVITNLSNPENSTGDRAAFYNYQGSNVIYHGNSVSGTGYKYGFEMHGGTGNIVGCDNQSTGHSVGLSNVPCQP